MILYNDTINPQVNTANDQLAELVDGYLSPSKLKELSGCEDLDHVTSLVLKVDTRTTSISTIGKLLPSLEQFKLNNSYIPSIRDLGTGYHTLTILWLARCNLTETDGISSSCTSLRELYLANNEITDISSIGMLESLQVLDLEGNRIEDVGMVEELALCQGLVELTLVGNPVERGEVGEGDEVSWGSDAGVLGEGRKEWRAWVWSVLPNLCVLDDEELSAEFDPESAAIPAKPQQPKRPVTSFGHSSSLKINSIVDDNDFSSDLTFGNNGATMAGNPILFLRSRRGRSESAKHQKHTPGPLLSTFFSNLSNTSTIPTYSAFRQPPELISITKLSDSVTNPMHTDTSRSHPPDSKSHPTTRHLRGGRRIHLTPTVPIESQISPLKPAPPVPLTVRPPGVGGAATVFRRRREFVRTLKPLDVKVGVGTTE
ncbi:Leucine-rich repeat-containing protein 56 [Podochytrium sp. JEL0797]|nr:Leucine-rich repeat-containing protein 56 [Podochytrium sp. JEL0797]